MARLRIAAPLAFVLAIAAPCAAQLAVPAHIVPAVPLRWLIE